MTDIATRLRNGHYDAVMEAADEIDCLRDEIARLREALGALLGYAESNRCAHDDTYRGGAIWEICNDCGAKWADDRGGKPKFREPKEFGQARAALAPVEVSE